MARMYDLRQKEVINTLDGTRYGFISDVEVDTLTGCIVSLIIPGPGRVLGVFGREQEYHIPWDMIIKIGDDIILVECETGKVLVNCLYS